MVGVGASAGGLEAMEELFGHMPIDTGMAFVVVSHQHPGHSSLLPELLDKVTELPVLVAEDGITLKPNHVYVAPPGGSLACFNGRLHRLKPENPNSPVLPINSFFRSLADDRRESAIGIVLSGTGTDGTLGIERIKSEMGIAMVQKPESAKYAGMPSSAIATGLADYVLPPDKMPEKLLAHVAGHLHRGGSTESESSKFDLEPIQKIFLIIRSRTGHDFSSYKMSTLRRRIERRMSVHQIGKPDQYVRYLQENPHEIDSLFREFLISVTNFFRDPEAWESLGGSPLDNLLAARPNNHTLRVWVPGCATGEEAYTVAILLREAIGRSKRHFDVQVFGTDLDARAIESARTGRFSEDIAGDMTPDRLQTWFVHEDGSYRIRTEIREITVFAEQSVIKDPPFSNLDLICCRNLQIYLNSDLQKKLLPIFHYALRPGGILFLGPSETVGSWRNLFSSIDRNWKIFQRIETTSPLHNFPIESTREKPTVAITDDTNTTTQKTREPRLATMLERLLLERFVPASVIVTERGDIVYIHGRTGSYLEPAAGEPSNNILKMARDGLRVELATALRQAISSGVEVTRKKIRVKTNGDFENVNLTLNTIKAPEGANGLVLVTFCISPASEPALVASQDNLKGALPHSGEPESIEQLKSELQYVSETLQTTIEELETSNEELKSANEELQSTNEEIQSSNEELETSKEEMQSLNEELTTVNAELQAKVDELSHSNNDMQNLLNGTDIATVFLDYNLCIKRYTKQFTKLIRLIPSDIGRPIADLATSLEIDNLTRNCREVLDSLVFQEFEVRSSEGNWFQMRIMPYRTIENVIDGIVITLVNIDELKANQLVATRERALSEAIVNTVREPLVILDEEMVVMSGNDAFYQVFKTEADRATGRPVYELTGENRELRNLLEDILPKNQCFEDYRITIDPEEASPRQFILNARKIEQEKNLPSRILMAMEEVD